MNIETKIECVRREIKRRKKFYPLMIEDGKLKQENADFEIATMQAIFETLTQLKGIISA
jgi:hypothetical protein